MLVFWFLACDKPCAPTTLWAAEASGTADTAYREATRMASWAELRCLAEVRVSPNARLGGDVWRGKQGWSVSVLPEQARDGTVDALVCEAIAYENAPLRIAPEGLFSADGKTRVEAFVEACAQGPTDRIYIEQSTVCGLSPLTEEQHFLQTQVFTREPLVEAPAIEMTRRGDLVDYSSLSLWQKLRTTTQNELLWVESAWGEPTTLHRMDALGQASGRPLPVVSPLTLAADEDRVVMLTAISQRTATVTVFHRESGELEERTVDWPEGLGVFRESPSTLVGDSLIVGSHPDNRRVGLLAVVDLQTGTVRSGRVPAPPPVGNLSIIEQVWPDPSRAGGVLIEVSYGLSGGEQRLMRFDPETGAFETVFVRDVWQDRQPQVRVIGPQASGDVVIGFQVHSQGWLYGSFDLHTGDLSISDTACTSSARSSFILDDSIVRWDGEWSLWDL